MAVAKNRYAYARLQELIRQGGIASGERLPLRGTARRLGMTISTVQAAIRRLEQDGLVETVDGWGSRVAQPSIDDIRGEYLLRRAVECEAAHIACENVDEVMATRLRELARQVDAEGDAARDARNMPRYVETDCALHLAIAQVSGVKRLVIELEKLHLRSMVWRNAADTVDVPQIPHRPLVDAVLSGDPEKAHTAMHAHITGAMNMQLRALKLNSVQTSFGGWVGDLSGSRPSMDEAERR